MIKAGNRFFHSNINYQNRRDYFSLWDYEIIKSEHHSLSVIEIEKSLLYLKGPIVLVQLKITASFLKLKSPTFNNHPRFHVSPFIVHLALSLFRCSLFSFFSRFPFSGDYLKNGASKNISTTAEPFRPCQSLEADPQTQGARQDKALMNCKCCWLKASGLELGDKEVARLVKLAAGCISRQVSLPIL